MKNELEIIIELMEGRTFILGRGGHIYIDSPTASKYHAEIKIADGKIYLRDMDSTNGTFLLKNKMRVQFIEGYVNPHQQIVIGNHTYVIQELLATASDFMFVDGSDTQVEIMEELRNRMAS